MSVFAITGNENFTLVENSAGIFQNLQSSFEQSVESKIEKLTVYDENFAKEVVGLGTIFTVTGYAPDNFGSTTKDNGVFLNILPNNKPATSVDDKQLLHLPVGARVIAMRITNNGTTITGSVGSKIDIDCQQWVSGAPSGNRLANETPTGTVGFAGPASGVNSPAGVKFWPAKHTTTASGSFNYPGTYPANQSQDVTITVDLPQMTLGTAGEEQARADFSNSVLVTSTTREVGVLVKEQDLAGGDLAVKLWYIADTEVPGNRP